jgi:hypothetical protein
MSYHTTPNMGLLIYIYFPQTKHFIPLEQRHIIAQILDLVA